MSQEPIHNKGFLIFICLVAALGGLLFGFDLVVIGSAVPGIESQFDLAATFEEDFFGSVGFFTSTAILGCIFGVAICGWMNRVLGRKWSLILSAFFLLASALGCAVANSIQTLILARTIGGIGVGVASVAAPLYIAEIAPPRLRGGLVASFQLTICIGLTLAVFSSAQIISYGQSLEPSESFSYRFWASENWRSMLGAETIPALIFFVLCLFVPLSPRWLYSRGRKQEALQVLHRVRGDKDQVEAEAEEIEHHLKNEEKASFSELFSAKWRKPLFVGSFLAAFSDFSGISVFLYYHAKIFKASGLPESFTANGMIWIGLAMTIFTGLSMVLVDRFGRKMLMGIGNAGCAITIALAGLELSNPETINGIYLIVVLCLFVSSFSISLGPIKWIVISEIFPSKLRSVASSVATMALWLAVAFNTFVFPSIQKWAQQAWGSESAAFYICAALLVIQGLFIWKVMPETKGKSLEEIEDYWANRS